MVYVYNEDTPTIWNKNALFSSQIEDHLPFGKKHVLAKVQESWKGVARWPRAVEVVAPCVPV